MSSGLSAGRCGASIARVHASDVCEQCCAWLGAIIIRGRRPDAGGARATQRNSRGGIRAPACRRRIRDGPGRTARDDRSSLANMSTPASPSASARYSPGRRDPASSSPFQRECGVTPPLETPRQRMRRDDFGSVTRRTTWRPARRRRRRPDAGRSACAARHEASVENVAACAPVEQGCQFAPIRLVARVPARAARRR